MFCTTCRLENLPLLALYKNVKSGKVSLLYLYLFKSYVEKTGRVGSQSPQVETGLNQFSKELMYESIQYLLVLKGLILILIKKKKKI